MRIEIREIEFGTMEYEQELLLRDDVLRKPIGLRLSAQDTELDQTDRHVAAFQNSRLVGCCLFRQLESVSGEVRSFQIKMRQVAVDPPAQGLGVGRKLIEYFETLSRARGATEIVLDARESAVSFYERLGYEVVSELFTQVTVAHRKMRKLL